MNDTRWLNLIEYDSMCSCRVEDKPSEVTPTWSEH